MKVLEKIAIWLTSTVFSRFWDLRWRETITVVAFLGLRPQNMLQVTTAKTVTKNATGIMF